MKWLLRWTYDRDGGVHERFFGSLDDACGVADYMTARCPDDRFEVLAVGA